jgi:CHAT domain-containing protein
VVLAGCRTAVGASAREGTLGVAGSFLAAGTPTVVATIWDIDDAVARHLFLEFHRRFVKGGDAAEALRQTQLAFLESTDPLLAHPASWAGIVHLGAMANQAAASTAAPGL